MRLTVHIVLNSHLDPVWRWTWPQGVDEVLNTTRTNCDILDEYPEIVITRGEAWFYDMIERLDPALFTRVERHVRNNRLVPVGGWWIQPDCNLPTAASFRKQAEIGKSYFRERFGVDITVGYNVDSFGHAATLPDFLAEAGYDAYVMMRPSPNEKTLPASLFPWESPSGARPNRTIPSHRDSPGHEPVGFGRKKHSDQSTESDVSDRFLRKNRSLD